MKWFRFHSDALDNPKVQRLPGDLFKSWVNLLCLANRNPADRGVLPSIADIAFGLRITDEDAERIVADLKRRRLLEETDDGLMPNDWNDHQPRSDTPEAAAERKRRQREKEKRANRDTTREGHADVTVTVTPESRARTEAELETETTPTVDKSTGGDAPNDEEPEPDQPNDPDPEPDRMSAAEFRAAAAGLIREHLWLHQKPTKNGKGDPMANDLSVALRFRKEYTDDEILGGIEYARRVLAGGQPVRMLLFNEQAQRHRWTLAVEAWRRAEFDAITIPGEAA
jgi:hypothetical protein